MVDDNDAGTRAPANATTLPVAAALTEAEDGDELVPFELPEPGYQLGAQIGRGGMGEVIAAQDQRIGREVAFKRMRNANAGPEALARFLREARIQARLDHPAIVPVYELGKDAEGRPFFTMKRLAGKTLAEHLAMPGESRQRLLRAFAEVCLAVELAHSRGVVHRDLKPANIMLGDFGEVYVLDWGVARVLSSKQRPTAPLKQDDIDSVGGEHTVDGDMLGTVGYMAPEQMRGETSVGTAADVYSLGAILFEILTGEPLHPRGHPAVASTLVMTHASPAERKPDGSIPPELDVACTAALEAAPVERPTARVLGERVQAYLDGDRDLERRRLLAKEQLATARDAIASGDPDRRADAVLAAGRALALDASSTEAADLVTSLIVEPPAKIPPDLQVKLDNADTERSRVRGRNAVSGYLSLFLLTVLVPFLDVQSWVQLVALYAIIGAFIAISWTTYKTGRIFPVSVLLGTVLMAVVFSRLASPFMLVPGMMCGTLMALSSIPWITSRPWLLYGWALAVALVPSVLEWSGVISATTVLAEDRFEIRSAVLRTHGRVDLVALVIANAVFIIAVARFAIAVAIDRRAAQRDVIVQAWQLNQLLPKETAARTSSPAVRS